MMFALVKRAGPFGGEAGAWFELIVVDGSSATSKGSIYDEAIAGRVVELLNRHGLESVDLPEGLGS